LNLRQKETNISSFSPYIIILNKNAMPPKKIPPHAEEVDDIKRSLDMLTEEVSVVRQQQIAIMSLVEEVKALRLENSEKEKRIFSLENRVDELEQYTRMNKIIITGLESKPRSYARRG